MPAIHAISNNNNNKAQVAMLWDELHTRQPWRAATASGELLSFESEAQNTSSLLLVIAINTVRASQPLLSALQALPVSTSATALRSPCSTDKT